MAKGRKNLVIILYLLGGLLMAFSIFTFLYQYYAAVGSLGQVVAAIGSDRILTALWLTFSSAIVTTILALLLGVPLAFLFATKDFRGKALVETLTVDIPQTFPPVAVGMIYLLMLGPTSPFHINLTSTFIAIVIGEFFISAPFVVSFATRRFREIQKTGLDLNARSLGANTFQLFTTIFVPLSLRDIGAGLSLCWSRSMGELGSSLVFAGVIPFKTETIPTFVATQARTLTVEALAATILVTTASMLALTSFKTLSLRK
jgi:molybdate transport system permease protein